MADLDWFSCGVLALSVMIGVWRGLVTEILSLVNWALAFVLAQWLSPFLSDGLPMQGASEMVRFAAGFVIAFVLSLLLGSLVVFLIKKVVYVGGMGLIDRVLGGAFGALRGLVLLLAAVLVIRMTPLTDTVLWQEALSPTIAQSVLAGLKPLLPQSFAKYLP